MALASYNKHKGITGLKTNVKSKKNIKFDDGAIKRNGKSSDSLLVPQTEVSCVIKYFVFGFNVLFWLLGGIIAGIGIWAWSEKEMFRKMTKITSIQIDPAIVFIVGGSVIFIIGFTGCVGALRENSCLLLTVR
ncbi:DgyrCDS2076 [Dimorphilus gyrociliatus]|uniref:DgyrCDS2076 n=1 Tax=Dimorphilus gyrociliatus TaxID=2664684 RepID=A0A7I8VAH0_9ANNE|nr:DgyrCDS2076 [Dimorphilus gyrociliatus]